MLSLMLLVCCSLRLPAAAGSLVPAASYRLFPVCSIPLPTLQSVRGEVAAWSTSRQRYQIIMSRNAQAHLNHEASPAEHECYKQCEP